MMVIIQKVSESTVTVEITNNTFEKYEFHNKKFYLKNCLEKLICQFMMVKNIKQELDIMVF